MPIIGNLSEFPLPEVLLLIGPRTGRLRLLDVPEFGVLDVDFSDGEVQSMHIGSRKLTESPDMIEKLSAVVQSHGGMFEFRLQPVSRVPRQRPLLVNQLVMSLVCHVDEQMAQQKPAADSDFVYMLEQPQPEIWIEPELFEFLTNAKPFLQAGTKLGPLVDLLKLDPEVVYQNLTNLRLLGLIKLMDGSDTVKLEGGNLQEQVSRKSNDFLRASRAVGEIKRITTSMPKIREK